MTYGYHNKVAHIDLENRDVLVEEMDENWSRIYGGGSLSGAYFLLRDTPPKLDPFDPQNLLIFASSIIAGNNAPGLARFSIITKSPLSDGIGESLSEGPFGQFLKATGYDSIICKGKAESPVYLLIEDGKADIIDAAFLWGKDTNETTSLLEDLYDKDIAVAAIGQAGEEMVRYASVVSDRSNQAMRLGAGAVMGAKNVKAIVLKGGRSPSVYDEAGLAKLSSQFTERMKQNELSMWQKNAPGFSAWVDLSDEETAYLGVENFKGNLFDARENYSTEQFMSYYQGNKSCPSCPNDCIKYLNPDPAKFPRAVTGIHQEVTGALGPNIGNTNLQLMLEANVLCNLYGLDPVSLGFTISFAMECYELGILTLDDTEGMELKFGNEEDLLHLIELVAKRKGIGNILAEGVKRAAEQVGGNAPNYALHVKGVEMVSFEPRSQTNLGLGYAVSPAGPRYTICEHDWDFDLGAGWSHTLEGSRTLGILERIPMDYLGPDKVRNFKALNTIWSACDALNLSVFASAPTRVYTLEDISNLIHCITGWKTSSYEFMRYGERRNLLLRIYNLREGLSYRDDWLPERFFNEEIKTGRFKGVAINKKEFQNAIQTYYEMMGWDEYGVPRDGTIYDLGLEWTLPLKGLNFIQ